MIPKKKRRIEQLNKKPPIKVTSVLVKQAYIVSPNTISIVNPAQVRTEIGSKYIVVNDTVIASNIVNKIKII